MRIASVNYKHRRVKAICCMTCILLVGLYGCTTDVFNAEKVKAAYQDRFPVKDIDPEMDWKMTGPLPVDIAINEDWGTDYTVRIYTANPLAPGSDAKVLGEGVANRDMHFITTIDCPSILNTLYVTRMDTKGRVSAKPVKVSGGTLTASFGWRGNTRTRNVKNTSTRYAGTECPYTEARIEQMLKDAEAYDGKKPLYQGVYKTSKKQINELNISEKPDRDFTLIVAPGTNLGINDEISVPDGVEIVVAPGGTLSLKGSPHTLCFTGNSSLVVLGNYSDGGSEQGIIDSDGQGGFVLDNTGTNYNAGTISVRGDITLTAGTVLYNYGRLETPKKLGDEGGMLINHCYARCATLENVSVDMQPLSYLTCETFRPGSHAQLLLGNNAFVDVTGTAALECVIGGPVSDGEQALFRLSNDITDGTGSCTGYVHFETNATAHGLESFIENNGDGLCDLSRTGHANVYIPSDACNGNTGNEPVEPDSGNGDDDNWTLPDTPLPYTYVFEDNYPLVGDYDFNDVVLDVTTEYQREKKTNQIRKIQLNISLAAVGASKAVGIGLRIVGITPVDIAEVTAGGDKKSFQQSFNTPYNLFHFNSGTLMENGTGNEVIIPIAGEAHEALGSTVGTLINTGAGVTEEVRTYEVIIELSDQTSWEPLFSKDNLDFFICYQYKNMQRRMEVHLYEFWKYGATSYGTIQKENLDLAGNNTWAVCVPYRFRYPKETVNISVTSTPSEGAYPLFIGWAEDRNTNQDWYNYPNEDKVYR